MFVSDPWYHPHSHPPTVIGRSLRNSRICVLHRTCFARNPTQGLVSFSKALSSAHFCSNRPSESDTGVLLIDFDMSLDLAAAKPEVFHAQTVRQYQDMCYRLLMSCPQGTPTFVARAVVSGKQKQGTHMLMPMPQFDQAPEAFKAYEAAVPDRLHAFPANIQRHYTLTNDIPHNPFKHELQYDAESVFWLRLFLHIQPMSLRMTKKSTTEFGML
jgi:hypothetical protein